MRSFTILPLLATTAFNVVLPASAAPLNMIKAIPVVGTLGVKGPENIPDLPSGSLQRRQIHNADYAAAPNGTVASAIAPPSKRQVDFLGSGSQSAAQRPQDRHAGAVPSDNSAGSALVPGLPGSSDTADPSTRQNQDPSQQPAISDNGPPHRSPQASPDAAAASGNPTEVASSGVRTVGSIPGTASSAYYGVPISGVPAGVPGAGGPAGGADTQKLQDQQTPPPIPAKGPAAPAGVNAAKDATPPPPPPEEDIGFKNVTPPPPPSSGTTDVGYPKQPPPTRRHDLMLDTDPIIPPQDGEYDHREGLFNVDSNEKPTPPKYETNQGHFSPGQELAAGGPGMGANPEDASPSKAHIPDDPRVKKPKAAPDATSPPPSDDVHADAQPQKFDNSD